jgi:hypothetical protein
LLCTGQGTHPARFGQVSDANTIFWHAELLLPPPFHPHSAVSVCSLGASWVFSIQPVLPPVIATFHSISQMECWARAMTQSPELGF